MEEWTPGELVVRRDVWLGHVRHATPARAVHDQPDLLAWWVAPGTVYKAACGPRGDMATGDIIDGEGWVDRQWFGGGALHLVRPYDPFALVALFAEDFTLRCWYVNLQLPVTRSPLGVDTMDMILDVVVAPDLSEWTWKDEDQFEDAIQRRILSRANAAELRSAGREAVARLRSSPAQYRRWSEWRPPTAWNLPSLPNGWDTP